MRTARTGYLLLGYASMTAGEMKAGLDRLATAAGIR